MRILFISHQFYPDIGGIEVNSEILARHFYNFGAEVHLLTWTADEGDKDFSFKVVRNPDLMTLFKEFSWADAVFENNPTLRLSWPLIFFQKAHVIAIRTLINRKDGSVKWRDKLKLKWLEKAETVIAVSSFIKKKTFAKALVIPNPYRADLFKLLPNSTRKNDFVFLGRLVSDKGADMAVKLLEMLHSSGSKFSNLTLTIIGDGPEKERLQKLTKKYDLTNFVEFTGFLKGEELNQKLNQHNYLLVASRAKEGFGNVALEGMACGCLPFVSDGGGLPQAVGKAGVIFERNNINSLFRSVSNVLENPELECVLRSKAEEHLGKHKPNLIAKRYFEIIETTVNLNA